MPHISGLLLIHDLEQGLSIHFDLYFTINQSAANNDRLV